jgi:glycosyltransferase involved in cell wall biosynthesis
MADEVPDGSTIAHDPLVTIIVPVYDQIDYLKVAIDSVIRQTYLAIEVIVVDDGSPVDPWQIVAPMSNRVVFLRTSNGGQAAARNFGADSAKGEYLLFLDDDDFLEPDAVEALITAVRRSPGARWAAGRINYVDESGRRLDRVHPSVLASGNVYCRMIEQNLMVTPSAVLVYAGLMHEVGGFDESRCVHMADDYDLWLSLAKGSPLAAVNRPVTNYRLHPLQLSRTRPTDHACAVLEVLRKHRALAEASAWPAFDRSIARNCRELGDMYYVGERIDEARAAWREAKRSDSSLPRWPMWVRFAKTRLPRWLRVFLRAVFGCVRRARQALHGSEPFQHSGSAMLDKSRKFVTAGSCKSPVQATQN